MTGEAKVDGGGQVPHSLRFVIWSTAAAIAVATVIVAVAASSIFGGDDGPDTQPIVAGATVTPSAATSSPTGTAAASPNPRTDAPEPTVAITVPPVATSLTATPSAPSTTATATPPAVTPTSRSSLFPEAAALADSIEAQFGVRIVDSRQDWGATEDLQTRNIAAVGEALASVPLLVRVTVNSQAPLAFLSNHTGATEAGWEPYGQREANYYTNEDVSVTGRVASNQVVLQPGSSSQTIAHEIMHGYQMRSVEPGMYALALISTEMKSFMAATGWVQLGTDDEVRAATGAGWESVNVLFRYDGRSLTYLNQFGDSLTLYTPNPVEAYAETGGLLYGHNSAMTLPDWPEYWDWFRANVG